MGNTPANSGGQLIQQLNTLPERPHRGPAVNYFFIAGGKTGDVLLPIIQDYHRKGHRLLEYKKKPLSEYYSGIFREPSREESREEWELGVLNLWLHGQWHCLAIPGDRPMRDMWITDALCLADAIGQNLKNGERLVSISMTKEQKTYSQKDIPVGVCITPGLTKTVWCPHDNDLPFDHKERRHGIMVEVFYEKPVHQTSERFIYNVAAVPATIDHINLGYLGLANVICDWPKILDQYLNQGWKLVDIYADFRPPPETSVALCTTMTQFQYEYGSGDDKTTVATWHPVNMNILWVFEKPASRQNFPTRVYEGKIIPFDYKVGSNPVICWDEVIRDMGKRGWELACFVERASAFYEHGDVRMRSLLFFQRPIPPPDYTDLDLSACGGISDHSISKQRP